MWLYLDCTVLLMGKKTRSIGKRAKGCRILISVEVDNSLLEPDIDQWTNWLKKSAPPNIGAVEVKLEE